MSERRPRLSQLPISSVRVLGAEFSSERHAVYCQRRLATIAVGHCRACAHFRELEVDDDGTLSAVVCDEAPDQVREATIPLPRLSVGDLMARDVLCVRPDLTLDAAALLLLEHPGKPLPVVDESGHVLGIVLDCDIQLEIQTQRGELGTVVDAMTPGVVSVPEATPASRAAAIMAFEGIACLVAMSPTGAVVGILTAADVLAWLATADGYLPRSRRPTTR